MSTVSSTDHARQNGAVLDGLAEIVFHTDGEGRWTYLNRAWEEITGFAIQTSLGRPFLEFLHPEEIEDTLRRYEVVASGQADVCQHVTRLLTSDGESRWIELRARAERDDGGNIISNSGTIIDISERRQAEELLAAQTRILELIAHGTQLHETLREAARVISDAVGAAGALHRARRPRHRPRLALPERARAARDAGHLGPRRAPRHPGHRAARVAPGEPRAARAGRPPGRAGRAGDRARPGRAGAARARAARPADQRREPHACCTTGSSRRCARPSGATARSACSCSTSTASRRSTTTSGTPPATPRCRPWPSAPARRCGPRTRSPGSAATSSPSSFPASVGRPPATWPPSCSSGCARR